MNIKNGSKVTVHYVGTLKDGTVFDSSRAKNSPLSFVFGGGQILPAFEQAVQTMAVGESKSVVVPSAEGYGELNPDAVRIVPTAQFGDASDLEVGALVQGTSPDGNPLRATVKSIEADSIILDFNHPLAGKDLNFEVELLDIEDKQENIDGEGSTNEEETGQDGS